MKIMVITLSKGGEIYGYHKQGKYFEGSDFGVHNTKSGKDMLRIPASAFLYLLGHAEKNGYKGID